MKKYDHIEYTRNLAVKLKELRHRENEKHFTRATSINSMEEFLANAGQVNGAQLIAIDELMSGLIDNQSDNVLDRQSHTFFILKNAKVGDIEAQTSVREDCKVIARKCLSKYFRDRKTDLSAETDTGVRNLEISRIIQQSVGPVGDNFFGVMVMLPILESSGIVFRDEDWDE